MYEHTAKQWVQNYAQERDLKKMAEQLTALGISEDKAIEALEKYDGNVEQAAAWCFQ